MFVVQEWWLCVAYHRRGVEWEVVCYHNIIDIYYAY